jgi:histidine phosphotransfer protein HptB
LVHSHSYGAGAKATIAVSHSPDSIFETRTNKIALSNIDDCRLSSLLIRTGQCKGLLSRIGEAATVGAEKRSNSALNQEIIARAPEGQGSRFNHLKSERFDPESLWGRVDGDLDLLRELVGVFAEEAPRTLAQIQDAIHHGSATYLEKASHKMKGAVLQFSAHAAAAAALELEQKGKSGSVAGAEPLLNKLRHEIELLKESLHRMVWGDATR